MTFLRDSDSLTKRLERPTAIPRYTVGVIEPQRRIVERQKLRRERDGSAGKGRRLFPERASVEKSSWQMRLTAGTTIITWSSTILICHLELLSSKNFTTRVTRRRSILLVSESVLRTRIAKTLNILTEFDDIAQARLRFQSRSHTRVRCRRVSRRCCDRGSKKDGATQQPAVHLENGHAVVDHSTADTRELDWQERTATAAAAEALLCDKFTTGLRQFTVREPGSLVVSFSANY